VEIFSRAELAMLKFNAQLIVLLEPGVLGENAQPLVVLEKEPEADLFLSSLNLVVPNAQLLKKLEHVTQVNAQLIAL